LKKYLFILLAIGLAVGLAACDEGGTSSSSSGKEKESAEKKEKKEDKKYGLGETAEVGDVKVTITKVSLTDERNEFEESEPNKVVKIEYEMENNRDEEIPVGADFQVYDSTGNQVDLYALDNTMGSLKPGKKLQGVEHYGIEDGPIEVYFQPMFSLDKNAIFELDVE